MALKRKLTAAEHAALPDAIKAEYKAEGAGFVLDTDDATELLNARDAEKTARKAAEKALKDAQDALAALTDDTSRKAGDVAALDASYKKKLEDADKAKKDAEVALANERRDRHVTAEAANIAKRFTVPTLVQDRIAKRLDVEIHDGKAVVRVLDKDGKPSALSIKDLEKEFVDNPDFKAIVIASKATGSAGDRQGPGAVPPFQIPTTADGKPQLLSKMAPKDFAAHLKATDPNPGEA